MAQIEEPELMHLLTAFIDNPQITLRDLARRAEIIRLGAHDLLTALGGAILRVRDEADQNVGGEGGAYALLAGLRPFAGDPLQKKATAFLMAAGLGGLWPIRDPEKIVPMVDYHRMRVLLRTGCIRPTRDQDVELLRSRHPVSTDLEAEVRDGASEVSRHLASNSGHPPFVADVMLWAHARSVCRHHPICVSGEAERSSFFDLTHALAAEPCVFASWCLGAKDEHVRSLWEPAIDSEYY